MSKMAHMGSISRFVFFFTSAREIRIPISDYLIQSRLLSSPVTRLSPCGGSSLVLDYLKQSGFSEAQMEKIIKRVPKILVADLDRTIKPKVQLFIDLGFSPDDTAQILTADPTILTNRAADRISHSIAILKGVLGSDSGVARALKASTWFLKSDLEKNFVPNIELMISRGVGLSQILRGIYNYPRLLLNSLEAMREFVKRADEIGFDGKSGVFFHAIRAIGSMSIESWESKLELFRNLGFSEHDVMKVFRRSPQVFTLSERGIREAVDFFLNQGKADLPFIVEHPSMLTLSVEHRLKPRMKVLNVLNLNNLLAKEPSLTTVMKVSEQHFVKKYVLPHFDLVGELYATTVSGRSMMLLDQ
ncbi:hypothetical protein Dimus_006045 [Dionaea muscipula]